MSDNVKKVNLKSAFAPIIFFGLGILVTVLFIVAYTFVTRPSGSNVSKLSSAVKTSGKSYAIVDKKTNELLIYNLEDKKLKKTGIQGVAVFQSPNLLYTAYTDNKDSKLRLLSNESLESSDIEAIESPYTPSWSVDGNKLIYAKKDGELAAGVPKVYTWLYDIKQNTKIKVTEGWPMQWVDDNRIIVSNQEIFYLVDPKSGELTKIN